MRLLIIVFLLAYFLCLGCNNKNGQPLTTVQLDSISKVLEDSIRLAHKLHIQDSLKCVDGDTIIGGFFFGMPEIDYEQKKTELISEGNGSTKIGHERISFEHSYPWIYKGRLRKYTIYTERNWSSRDYKGGIESVKDLDKVFASLIETFTQKYGEPDKLEERNALWAFDFKTIEIIRQSQGNNCQQVRIEYTQTEYVDTLLEITRKQNEEYEKTKELQKLKQEKEDTKHSKHF